MPIGTTLLALRIMLKGEIGANLTTGVAPADDGMYNWMINNRQQWLASHFDWPMLERRFDVNVAAGAGGRYNNLPAVCQERPVKVEVFYNNRYQEVQYGIDSKEFNYLNSDLNQVTDPIQRWRYSSLTQFETWPLASTPQTVRFTGQQIVTSFVDDAGVFDDAVTCCLDDQMIVLFAAAQILTRRKQADAQMKLAEAQNRMNLIRGCQPSREEELILMGARGGHLMSKNLAINVVHG